MAVNDRYSLFKSKTPGVDSLVDILLSDEETPEKDAFQRALLLYKTPFKKRYIEACLLASNDIEKISTILGISPEILFIYERIFYDISELDNLSKLELLEVSDREESMLKRWALSQGLDFITWRLGGSLKIDPVEGLNELFTLSTFKSKEALFTGNSSEASKEAVKWVKTSMDLARLMKAWVLDSDSAKRDIELALKEVMPELDGLGDLSKDLGVDLDLLIQAPTFEKLPSASD